jgi:hypothetical protein
MFKPQAAALAAVVTALAALPALAGAAPGDPPIAVSHASGGADVSDLTQTSVVLHAGVVANGHSLSCEVDYARDNFDDPDTGPYTASLPCREAIQANADGEQPISVAIGGLEPGSHYRFQFLVKDRNDASITRHTNESSFTTMMVAPTVVTGPATGIADFAATLNGTVDPHGDATTCRFDIGTTTNYDGEVSCADKPGTGEGPVAVSANVSDLTPGATYHYRLVAAKRDQEVAGADQTFTVPLTPSGGGGGGGTGSGGGTTTGGGNSTNNNNGTNGGPTTTAGRLTLAAAQKVRSGRVRLKLSCASHPCRGTLTLKAKLKRGGAARTIGHARVSLAAGKSQDLSIRLTSAATSALRKHHGLTVQVSGLGVHRTLRLT